MKKILTLFIFFNFATLHAGTGNLFSLTNTSTANGLATQIKTMIPNHRYPKAGLLLPQNYRLSSGSCDLMLNDVCILNLNDTTARSVYLIGQAKSVSSRLCLNGVGGLNCQQYFIQSVPKMLVAGNQKESSNSYLGLYNLINGNDFSNANVISDSFTGSVGEFKAASCTNSGSFCMVAGFLNTTIPYSLNAVASTDQGDTWFDISNAPNPNNLSSAQIWGNTCDEKQGLCVAVGEVRPAINVQNTAYLWIYDINSRTWTDQGYIDLDAGYYGSLNVNTVSCYSANQKTRCALAGYTNAGQTSDKLPLTVLVDIDAQKHISTYQITTPTVLPTDDGQTYYPAFYGVSCGSDGGNCIVTGLAYPNPNNGNNIPVTYTSANGGLSWVLSPSQPSMPSDTYVEPTTVACANNGLNCTLGAWSHPAGNNNRNTASAVVYTTSNGGKSWGVPVTVVASSPSSDPSAKIYRVACSQSGTFCVAVGGIGNQYSSGVGSNFRTSYPFASYSYDGGKTWSPPSQLYPRNSYGNSAYAAALVSR